MKLHRYDVVNPYGAITRISDYYVWFGTKRYSINTVKNKNKAIYFKNSPDTVVDWTDERAVDAYYNSFTEWSTAVRMGDPKKLEILEVKNNKILKDGEYYLPFKYIDSIPSKAEYEDGYVWGFCIKKNNAWYSNMGGPIVNIFIVNRKMPEEEMEAQTLKKALFKATDVLTYLRSIDSRFINSKDLQLYKQHLLDLMKPLLPYKFKAPKPVLFKEGMFGSIEIHHRNRVGFIRIDNSYYGARPYGNDYGLIVRADPGFTNELKYYCSIYNPKFNAKFLDDFAKHVIKEWDIAIESNARYIG